MTRKRVGMLFAHLSVSAARRWISVASRGLNSSSRLQRSLEPPRLPACGPTSAARGRMLREASCHAKSRGQSLECPTAALNGVSGMLGSSLGAKAHGPSFGDFCNKICH